MAIARATNVRIDTSSSAIKMRDKEESLFGA
jgi:hypothetical protein